ncbi:hypothetical protein A0H81_09440 [Grifola frondosa]|uniref:Uncharacterized protein n=1 Tax=Grifola frondosa TaxID=5627 RepID=A0A1C7M2G8_GRIFR|nr:hypothetical protein A0H81_09440 [Grifola frondosa]
MGPASNPDSVQLLQQNDGPSFFRGKQPARNIVSSLRPTSAALFHLFDDVKPCTRCGTLVSTSSRRYH